MAIPLTIETRNESFKSVDKKSRQKIILNALGNSRLTARQIAYKLGYKDLNYVKPRLTELLQEGTIITKDKEFDPITNRSVAVYQLNEVSSSKAPSKRKTLEDIESIKSKLGIKTLWSWSKYKTYENDPFTYYLKYVKKVAPDRLDSIYSPMGTAAHEIIDMYYAGNIHQEEMITKYKEKLYELSLFDYKFDRTNEAKNKAISDKYEKNLFHFFKNHKKPNYKTALEEFILIKLSPKIYFQGYIDCIHTTISEKGKEVWITDFKTSSLYTGKLLNEMAGQLLLYAMGIHQKTGIPYERIHIQFNFLKYLKCSMQRLNNKMTTTNLERRDYVEHISDFIKMWLKNSSENIDDLQLHLLLENVIKQNSLDILPENVKDKFTTDDCIIEVPYNENSIKELTENITKTISDIESKTSEYEISNCDDKKGSELFWNDITDKSSFFMANLSEYSANLHKPYSRYLTQKGY